MRFAIVIPQNEATPIMGSPLLLVGQCIYNEKIEKMSYFRIFGLKSVYLQSAFGLKSVFMDISNENCMLYRKIEKRNSDYFAPDSYKVLVLTGVF